MLRLSKSIRNSYEHMVSPLTYSSRCCNKCLMRSLRKKKCKHAGSTSWSKDKGQESSDSDSSILLHSFHKQQEKDKQEYKVELLKRPTLRAKLSLRVRLITRMMQSNG